MLCPKCKSENSYVIDCRERKDGNLRRRRTCMDCEHRFTTIEVDIADYDNLKELAATFKKLLALTNEV